MHPEEASYTRCGGDNKVPEFLRHYTPSNELTRQGKYMRFLAGAVSYVGLKQAGYKDRTSIELDGFTEVIIYATLGIMGLGALLFATYYVYDSVQKIREKKRMQDSSLEKIQENYE